MEDKAGQLKRNVKHIKEASPSARGCTLHLTFLLVSYMTFVAATKFARPFTHVGFVEGSSGSNILKYEVTD